MLVLALLLQAAAAPPAAQAPPRPPPLHGGPRTMTCAIGGETFEAQIFSHYSTWGERPDGRPQASWLMPLPIPTCPSNGLVMFRNFDAAALARLATLIVGAEYRALVAGDSTYYRAQWLATRLGDGEVVALGLLLPATWQVKPQTAPTGQPLPSSAKAIAYQTEFAARVAALPADTKASDRLWLQARAANALRELGRFADAEAMRRRALATAAEIGTAAARWQTYLDGIGRVVTRRDASVEPLDMIDPVRSAQACLDLPAGGTGFDREFCAAPERQAAIARARELRDRMRALQNQVQ